MKTLISPIVWINLDDNCDRLISSIGKTAGSSFYLGSPVSNNSYSYQANLSIKAAKALNLDYVLLLDTDTYFEKESRGWLSRLETAMDSNHQYGLLLHGDRSEPNNNTIEYADETNRTPYTEFAYAYYRVSTNILFDIDYLYFQSSDCDLIREMRRQNHKTGILRSVTVRHERKEYNNQARQMPYECIKVRNEQLFNQKWHHICHDGTDDWNYRNKWRGVNSFNNDLKTKNSYCKPIDDLADISNQYKTILPYFNKDNTLFLNDIQYINRNNIHYVDYYGEEANLALASGKIFTND